MWVWKTYATRKGRWFLSSYFPNKNNQNLFIFKHDWISSQEQFWRGNAHYHESKTRRKVEPETRPTLQNDTVGVPGGGSQGLMIHPPISTPPHFDRPLTRTALSTAASQRRCNTLLLLMNKSHLCAPISLCQPRGLWSGVLSLAERRLFPGPVLINWSYSLRPGKNKTGEEEEETTNTTRGDKSWAKSAHKQSREMERGGRERLTANNTSSASDSEVR